MAQLVHTRKTMKDGEGKPGDSSVVHPGEQFYPYPSNLRLHLNDSASDNSSLFDEVSTCSTESTRDSTSTEEPWEHTSGESDFFVSNSPMRISEDYDGFTHSPLGSQHPSKANYFTPSVTHIGSNACSSGREIDREGMERSFMYPDNSRNLVERRRSIETNLFIYLFILYMQLYIHGAKRWNRHLSGPLIPAP